MCLENFTKFGWFGKLANRFWPQKGWKVIRVIDGKVRGQFYDYEYFEFDKTVKAIKVTLEIGNIRRESHSTTYTSGFHIFTKKKDAIRWARHVFSNGVSLIEVKYKNKQVKGIQRYGTNQYDVIVAQKVKFIKKSLVKFEPTWESDDPVERSRFSIKKVKEHIKAMKPQKEKVNAKE